MNTIKIGDKFQVIKSCNGEYVSIGDVLQIKAIQSDIVYVASQTGATWIKMRWFKKGHLKEIL